MAYGYFGLWLERRRKYGGLTQEQLARQIGCSTITVRKLESEERRPSVQVIERLAEIFNIPPEEHKAFLRFARGDSHAIHAQTVADEHRRTSGDIVRSNMPAPMTSLIGRQEEVAVVHGYLLDASVRLVTLIGPPGIGKTRLSIEIARGLLPYFPDGVFFVPLAELEKSSQVAPAIFQALGYVESGNQFTARQLAESIGDKKMLVVLDNLEHLIDESAQIVYSLFAACPQVKFLTTSRESLHVQGEWLYSVSSLGVPAEKTDVSMETVTRFPALILFAERARAANASFHLNSGNVQTIASICTRLEGVPLAIELIARRMQVMSPASLLDRLNNQFILSADGMRAVPTRQKTLHNAINWGYTLLSGEEQELLMRLSVFSGDFSVSKAESMLEGVATTSSAADLIGSLLDKSLIQISSGTQDGYSFNMLMMIRQFALEELRKSGREDAVRDLHLSYFLSLVEHADREIHGPDQLEWLEIVERNHNDFQNALDWCVTKQKTEDALRLLGALGWAWLLRGHYSEMRGWFDRIRALPGISDHPASYARLLNRVGCHSWNLGYDRDAQALLEEGRDIWVAMGERGETGLADCLNWMGMAARYGDGYMDEAISLVETSRELYRKHNDVWGTAHSLLHAGDLESSRHRSASSLSRLEQSFALFEQVGDIWGKCQVYQSMGRLYLDTGEYDKARACFEQQMNINHTIREVAGIIMGLCDLGHCYLLNGETDQAEEYYEKSLMACRQYGLKPDRNPLFYLSIVALHRKDYQLALHRFVHHYQSAETGDKKRDVCDLSSGLAAVAGGTNQPERAARLSGASQAILEETGYQYPPIFRDEFEQHVQIARDQLGESRFAMLALEGRTMTMEQVIAYAIAFTE